MARLDIFYGEGHVVETPNGYRTIHTDTDLLDVIGECCGKEVQDLVDETLEDLCAENVYEKERAHTDADSYEASCEEYRDMLLEVREFIEQIMRNMEDHPRMKKDTIYCELSRIPRKITAAL